MDKNKLVSALEMMSKAFGIIADAIRETISEAPAVEEPEKVADTVVEKEETKVIPKNQIKDITEFGKRLIQVRDEIGVTSKELVELIGFKSKTWNVLIRSNPYKKTKTLIENSMLDDKYKKILLEDLPNRSRSWKIEDFNKEKKEEEKKELMAKCQEFIRNNGSLFTENMNMRFVSNEIMVKGEPVSPNVFSAERICEILADGLNIDISKIKSVIILSKGIEYWEDYYENEEHIVGDFISLVKTFIYQLRWKTIDIISELDISAATWNKYKNGENIMPAKVFERLINGTIGRQASCKPMILEVYYKKYNPKGYEKYLKLARDNQ